MDDVNSQGSDITPDPNPSSDNELQYDTLILFKNHVNSLEKFNRDVVTYKHELATKLFVNCLKMVMKDETCSPPQQDPLQIISTWAAWTEVRPLTFTDRTTLSPEEAKLKDAVYYR